jgi:hypothetical protein
MVQMRTTDHSGSLSDQLYFAAEVIESPDQALDRLGTIAASEVVDSKIYMYSTRSLSMCQAALSIEAATARMAFLAPRRALRRRAQPAGSS